MKQIIRNYMDSEHGYIIKMTPRGLVEPIAKPSEDFMINELGEAGYTGSGYCFLGRDIMVLYNPDIDYDPNNPNRNDCAQHIMFEGTRNEMHSLYTDKLPMSVKGDIYIDAWGEEPLSRQYVDMLLDDFEQYLSMFD